MSTPLSQLLHEPRAVSALDAFETARETFLAGDRIDMRALAERLGVSRTTLYRWVGSREQLLGEILWWLSERGWKAAERRAAGLTGSERLAAIFASFNESLARSEPTRIFLRRDPEYAARILTGRASDFQARQVGRVAAFIREEATTGRYEPPIDIDELALLGVRVGESFLFSSVVSGEKPDHLSASLAQRLLFSARPGQDAGTHTAPGGPAAGDDAHAVN